MSSIPLTQTPAHVRHGSNIGQPLTRRDGILKVTGAARYAADNHPPGMLYAVLAVSSIARGRVASLDVAAAKAHPGVVEVMTPANRPPLAQDPDEKSNPFMFRLDLLQNDRVRYANQPIAVVIAETLEAATEGAALLAPRYDVEPARVGLDATESFVPHVVGPGHPTEHAARRRRGRSRRGVAADRGDLRNAAAISQSDGAACDRRGMGRRYALDRHADPRFRLGAGTSGRPVRDVARQDPHPQSVPRRRLRLQRPDLGTAGARHHGGAAGRQAGQAGAAARADVRPGRTPGRRRGRPCASAPTTTAGSPRSIITPRPRRARSTISSSRRPIFRTRFMRARRSRPRTKRFGSIPERRCSCAPPARRPARSRSKARSTRWRTPAASTRWRSGSRTMPRSSRSPASRSRRRRCATAIRRAPRASAGSAARSRRGRCATATACWSAGASAPRRFRRSCSRRRPRRRCGATAAASWKSAPMTWGRAPGPRWRRSRPMRSGSTSTRSSSAPAPPIFPTPASPAAPLTPRLPAWRSTMPAPT